MRRQPSPFASSLRTLFVRGGAPLLAILTFSVPANLGTEYVIYTLYGPDDFGASVRISGLVSAITLPIHISVIVRAASASTAGDALSYAALLKSAVSEWAHVFNARFVATVLVNLGTLALVIPGILLAIRYSFVEVVAIEERATGTPARKRSASLASGRCGPILRLFASVVGAVVVVAVLVFAPLGYWPHLDNFAAAAFGDVVFDVLVTAAYGGAWFIYRAATAEAAPRIPEPIA